MIVAITAAGAGCEKAPQAQIAAAVAVDDVPEWVRPRPRTDLGGGCSADTPREVDRRAWPDAAATHRASPASDGRALVAIDDHHRLRLWRDGSSEQGFYLRAVALGDDGAAVGEPITLSNGFVGTPVALPAETRGVNVWFLQDTDTENEPRRLTTTVHCGP